jgi:uncharacterized repeat protein (TIGR03803 family)
MHWDLGMERNVAIRVGLAAVGVVLVAGAAAAAPVEKVLYNFDVITGGNSPQAALTAGPGGVYYGTTDLGGATGNGTVFELDPPAAGQTAWTEKVLYSFAGPGDGSVPSSGLLAGKDGVLYGVTGSGGANGYGVVFALTPPAAGQTAWTESVLYSFAGGNDGIAPYGTLVSDANGVLYGSTTNGGGSSSSGVVFSLTPPAAGGTAWSEAVLYSFQGGTDGVSPGAGLLLDASGALYGVVSVGGKNNAGAVYRLTPPAAGGSAWTKTALWNFGAQPDGGFPVGGLVRDPNGILYGVCNSGGSTGWGTVYALSPPAAGKKAWSESVLYSFAGGNDGGSPDATLVLGGDGTLYGVSNGGGTAGSGTAFSVTPPAAGGGKWTEAALVSFTGPNGSSPAGLGLGPDGGLIGSTFYGGTLGNGGGTVFTLSPPAAGGSAWTQTVVQQFAAVGTDAASPIGALVMGKSGVVFGSAYEGGAHGDGAVFALTPPASGSAAWSETVLHSFSGKDGINATGKLVEGKGGVLYGVTTTGGPAGEAGFGTAYALLPPKGGTGAWRVKVLHAFTGVANGDGGYPGAGLAAGPGGVLYGTTNVGGTATSDNTLGNGVVYELSPPANGATAWTETVIYRFGGPDGSTPDGALLVDKSGALYGTTYVGGSAGEGAVFKLVPPASQGGSWTESVLHSFNASVGGDGAIPGAEQLVMDKSGALYGTASQGGANNDGAVFKLAPPAGGGTAWTETVIHSFTGADGSFPFAGLLSTANGALYGVTEQGGAFQQYGTVFKLLPPASGSAWKATVLHSFNAAYWRDGADADAALIKDASGNLLGLAAGAGAGNGGVFYEVTQ